VCSKITGDGIIVIDSNFIFRGSLPESGCKHLTTLSGEGLPLDRFNTRIEFL